MINVIIVDDEPLAREGIRLHLVQEKDIKIVSECATGKQAVRDINRYEPDLVFLDIQMPGLNGFEVLQKLNVFNLPFIIFITAYDEFAMEAFKVHALDYLLKPLDDKRFQEALQRARIQLQQKELAHFVGKVQNLINDIPQNPPSRYSSRISIKKKGKIILVAANEIDWIEAVGDYLYLHIKKDKHLIRQTLTSFVKKLDKMHFQQIHRSFIVNINQIQELKADNHGEYKVVLKNGQLLKLSRTYRKHLEQALGTFF